MSNFRSPGNTIKKHPSEVSDFAGIGGDRLTVLKHFNDRGWNISNIFFNEVQDLNLGITGLAQLRDGKRKIDNNGKTASITSMFVLNLGGKKRYGIIYDGILDVIDLPEYTGIMGDPVDLNPSEKTGSGIYSNGRSYYTWHEIKGWTVDALRGINMLPVSTEYPVHDPSEFQT